MLILSRQIGEDIRIGDDITVRILSIKGKQVRLGIQAPLGVSVHREEIFKRILIERVIDQKAATI